MITLPFKSRLKTFDSKQKTQKAKIDGKLVSFKCQISKLVSSDKRLKYA